MSNLARRLARRLPEPWRARLRRLRQRSVAPPSAELRGVDAVEPQTETAETRFRAALARDPDDADAYVGLAMALRDRSARDELRQLGDAVRAAGLRWVSRGDLTLAIDFFARVRSSFPAIADTYLCLYRHIVSMISEPSVSELEPGPRGPADELVVSLTVWGERYADLLLRYFLPSMLAPGNIPSVSKKRAVTLEIYTTENLIESIEQADVVRELRAYAELRLVEFPRALVESEEYRNNPNLRYYIYGGFHHVSMARAKAQHADLICIAPDGVHSDGSFSRYVDMIDEGAEAVVFTSVRGQAESLLPALEEFRDSSGALAIPPRRLVGLAVRHVHHDFSRYVLSPEIRHAPPNMSIHLIPVPTGFLVRAFHLHPIVLSADCLRRPARYDFSTVDADMLARIFTDPDDWKRIRVIDDSDDGVMLDLTYQMEEYGFAERSFQPDEVAATAGHFTPLHRWYFSHQIRYQTDETVEQIGSYRRMPDGAIEPRTLSLAPDGRSLSDDLARRVAQCDLGTPRPS